MQSRIEGLSVRLDRPLLFDFRLYSYCRTLQYPYFLFKTADFGRFPAKGAPKVVVADLSRDDMAEVIEDAFRYDRLVLAAATYDAGIFPCMEDFLHHLKAKNYQKRKVAFMENGSWAPMAAKIMKGIVEGFKNIEMVDPVVTIKSTMNDENIKTMEELADNLL